MYWLIAAVLLFVAEMFLGTFYLLVISASLISAGLAQWLLGTGASVNVLIASVFSVFGIILVRRWQRTRPAPVHQAKDDNLDLGQVVVLEHTLPDGLWQVRYRGTQWQARLTPPASAAPGRRARILGHEGNVLLLEAIDD